MEPDSRLASCEAVEAKPEWSEALVALEKLENGLHKVDAALDRLRADLAVLGWELEAAAKGQDSRASSRRKPGKMVRSPVAIPSRERAVRR
ncbi:MAG: hypothetical protein HY729_10260 [Candidatus Rokubacteria bacterium]|nr:hypothetical protein [Candidatus Rokubacteria bacterium]